MEPGSEIQEEQVREVGWFTSAFHPYSLAFLLNHYLYVKVECELSL
jgi:hypothetical protein